MTQPTQIGQDGVVQPRVGDTVVADDGELGSVAGVIHTESGSPAYVVVAVGQLLRRRRPVIPWPLVSRVDRPHRRVRVLGRRAKLGQFSETLPLVL